VTSNPYGDPRAILLAQDAFATGSLRVASYARPGKLFTANASLIVSEVGQLQPAAVELIINGVIGMLRSEAT